MNKICQTILLSVHLLLYIISGTLKPNIGTIEFCYYIFMCLSSTNMRYHTAYLGPVLLTFLRHVARISANGIAAFKESCSPIG